MHSILTEYDQEKVNRMNYQQGLELGLAQGVKQGLEQGISRGTLLKCITVVRRMSARHLSAAEIADALGESPEIVQSIVLQLQANPDCSDEEILKLL